MEITVNDVIEKLKAGNYIQPVEVKFPTVPTEVEEIYELKDGDISFNYYSYDNPNFSNVDTFVKYNGNWYLLPYYDNTIDMICMFCMEQFAIRATDNSFYVPFENPRIFGLSKRLSYEEW